MSGTICFTPGEDDYVAAMRLFYIRQLQAAKFRRRMTFLTIGVALLVVIAIGALSGDWLQAIVTGVVGAACGVAALGFIIVMNFLLLPRRSRRLFRQQRSLHREAGFAWDDEGSHWTSDMGNARTAWPDYHRWTKGKVIILLYLNDQMMQFIPARAFQEGQIDNLCGTLRAAKVPVK